jgi:hypothetical protein
LKRRESKKVCHFRKLGFAVSVEESIKGRVFFPHGAGSLAARQETRKHTLLTLGGTFTVLLGLRDPSPNYTRQIQIRFGATSWGKIQTEHPSLLRRIAATPSYSLCGQMKS